MNINIILQEGFKTVSKIWQFMDKAVKEARENPEEIPVGCVIVKDGKIIASGHNTRESTGNILGHAEINALIKAAETLNDWRLDGAEMYVTLEPCPMCAGAIRAARISKLYFGAWDKKEGAAGSVYNLLYPHTQVYGGIMAEACSSLLKDYCDSLR